MDESNKGFGDSNAPWQFKSGEAASSGAEQSEPDQTPYRRQDVLGLHDPSEDSEQKQRGPEEDTPIVSWTASEFIAHPKSSAWYMALAGGAVVGAGSVYFIFHDLVATIVVVVAAIVFGLGAARQPRQLQYALWTAGLTIEEKFFPYEDFRSFSVVEQGAIDSVVFSPLKRFNPPLTIYYDPDDEEAIVNLLVERLPHEQKGLDAIDNLMRKIRF